MKKVIVCVLISLLFGCGSGERQIPTGSDQSIISACSSVAKTVDASVSVGAPDGGIFAIQGNSMDGVAGIDLTISYDGSLSSPSVTQGSLISGSLMAANTNNPGSIKIAVIGTKAFSGSGPLATVTFAKGTGSVKVATVNFINSTGASVGGAASSGVSTTITQPGIPFSQPTATSTGSLGALSYVDANGQVHVCP